jgi:hypothetical protein
MKTISQAIHELALPFAKCEYTDNWQYRASELSKISDVCKLGLNETAFFHGNKSFDNLSFVSFSPLRDLIMSSPEKLSPSKNISYSVKSTLLHTEEYDIFSRLYGRVDSSEKIVMTACAHALCNLSSPLEVKMALCNILYEESLHLMSISNLLGLDQSQKPWIADEKKNHLTLVSETKNIAEYIFLEHCLYEGRGFIAAASGVYELSKYDLNSTGYKIANLIFEQETNHVLTGYFWLKQFDNKQLENTIKLVLRKFISTEPIHEMNTFKGKRQRFPFFLLANYLADKSFWSIKEIVLDNAISIKTNGRMLPTDKELDEATKFCTDIAG